MADSTSDAKAAGAGAVEAAADRLYPARPFLAASVAVLRGDRVLLAARRLPPMAALYTLPGGQVEPGESLAEAALRELREEVGVEAQMIGFLEHVEIIERDADGRVKRHFVVCAHAARWLAGEGEIGPEAADIVWARPDEIADLKTTPGLRAIIDKAFALARAVS